MIHHRSVPVCFPVCIAGIALAASVLLTGSCSPSPDAAGVSTESPAIGGVVAETQPIARPMVTLPDGFEVNLELAITPEELAQGLMFRPNLAENRGMLLIFAEERLPNIWMMNTLVALDIIYLDGRGTVVDVITDAQPCPAEPCPRFTPKQPAQAVLEIPSGGAARHRVVEGSTLEFVHVSEFPTAE